MHLAVRSLLNPRDGSRVQRAERGGYASEGDVDFAYEPGTHNPFGRTTVASGGLIIGLEFPNHQGADPQYIENLRAFIRKTRYDEIPDLQGGTVSTTNGAGDGGWKASPILLRSHPIGFLQDASGRIRDGGACQAPGSRPRLGM